MKTLLSQRNRIVQFAILLTFFFVPFWLKKPNAPAPFSATYTTGFVLSWLMIVTIGIWIITGLHGFGQFFQSRWRVLWFINLLLLSGWAFISQEWALGTETGYAGLASSYALQLIIITGFVWCVACCSPTIKFIVGVLLVSMVLHGSIGIAQTIQQVSVGLGSLGEFTLNPEVSGVSVIMTDSERWLRPYGLLPHPNILGGMLAVSLLACAGWVLQDDWRRWVGLAVFPFGLWVLLLTFSRGAWLGLGVGILFALPHALRQPHFWRRIVPVIVLAFVVGSTFVVMNRDLLLVRAGVSEASIELRSVADRIVYNRIAMQAIEERPMRGYGAGNYPWYAANVLFYQYPQYDLRGDNVHNIYLGVWADLGLVGFVLVMSSLTFGMLAALEKPTTEKYALVAGVVALSIIGHVDHYVWTLPHGQVLWLGLLAVAMHDEN